MLRQVETGDERMPANRSATPPFLQHQRSNVMTLLIGRQVTMGK